MIVALWLTLLLYGWWALIHAAMLSLVGWGQFGYGRSIGHSLDLWMLPWRSSDTAVVLLVCLATSLILATGICLMTGESESDSEEVLTE